MSSEAANGAGGKDEINYEKSEEYWAKQPATVDGMLGGLEFVSPVDIEQSQKFLDSFLTSKPTNKHRCGRELALDCGAGIGRVSKHLLLKNFKNVEMIDVTENFIKKANEYLGENDAKRVLKFHCCGLQDFIAEPEKYDCIWIQWVTGYLTDEHLVDFFKRCRVGLRSNGICILKDNIAQNKTEFDADDSSVTRTRHQIVNLIHKAGMQLIRDEKQTKFPPGLFEVRLFAFK